MGQAPQILLGTIQPHAHSFESVDVHMYVLVRLSLSVELTPRGSLMQKEHNVTGCLHVNGPSANSVHDVFAVHGAVLVGLSLLCVFLQLQRPRTWPDQCWMPSLSPTGRTYLSCQRLTHRERMPSSTFGETFYIIRSVEGCGLSVCRAHMDLKVC